MAAQIRPNRLEVSDRFPMLGFTIRTDGTPQRAEVAIATDFALFRPEHKGQRTAANFYSSRAGGALSIPRGEAIYVVPPEVLARFIGAERLYVALATTPERNGTTPHVDVLPGEGSPYVSLKGLTGRSLRRVRLLPSRQQRAAGYSTSGTTSMEWAGDNAVPGLQPAAKATPVSPAAPAAPAAPAPVAGGNHDYDDGFGPLPPPEKSGASNPAGSSQSLGVAQWPHAQSRAFSDQSADAEDAAHGIEGPIPDAPNAASQSFAYSHPLDQQPEYPQASRFVLAVSSNYRRVTTPRTINRVVIHITDGGPSINGTISWFQNPSARVSAHYVVGQDGEVVQMVRHNDVAWHAGSANGDSIGIEHVANTRGLTPTEAEYCASAALVRWLCDTYGIPIDRNHILGHAEADPNTNHKACPNAVWDWDHFMDLVRNAACASSANSQVQALTIPTKVWARAQEVVAPFYDPADPASALTCQNDVFSQAREEWFVGVPNTHIFPHSAICQLKMVDAAGNGYGGTGFYIGPNRILTCAHNLHGMTSVTIIPGRNGSDEPFGRCTLDASSWRVSNRYPTDGSNFDLAVIDNVPITAPGGQWFGFLNQTPSDRLPIVVCGYSAQSDAVPELTQAIDGDMQHLHGGYMAQQSNLEVMEYPILTLRGASGSPVYHIKGSGTELRALVCGVHVSGEPAARGLNRACFITPNKINWIEGRTSALSLGIVRPLATERREAHFPPVRALSSVEREIALGALAVLSPPLAALISSARATTTAYNVSIGIGPAASVGLLIGAGVGAGLVFTPDGGVGIYGQFDIRAGLIDSASLELQFTIVKGGIESFRGINWAVAVEVDLGVSVSVQALFDTSLSFQGVTFGLGVGLGVEPIQVFLSVQGSYAEGLALALPMALSRLPQPPAPLLRRASALEAEPVAPPPFPGAVIERIVGRQGNVRWQLEQLRGVKRPEGLSPGSGTLLAAPKVRLDDWPIVQGSDGAESLPLTVDFEYDGAAVGNICIVPELARSAQDVSLNVTANIKVPPDLLLRPSAIAVLQIMIEYGFIWNDGAVETAIIELTLFGDGRYERQNRTGSATQAKAA